ncbi:hypothetical protein Poli38472_001155 [Pythium oligandrum]|uniref:Hexose transporter 1 n=1 Tax=Pythium oligandrum TaxID=41045 RepID=A0A8K1FQ34_PYTOL|nr:hypothetical protein Poli38472_001155 [Pythium oligandrum]|eukprot:TMW68999.1 hypothetical protein Poli38472_001155 [Pythium oligandrum]
MAFDAVTSDPKRPATALAIPMPEGNAPVAPFTQILTPLARNAPEEVAPPPPVTRLVYTSVMLAVITVMHLGWSLPQVNLSTFNNQADCDARPVQPGTCLMFPGHTKSEWLAVVNVWVAGGILGAFSSGPISDRFGRKKAILANCVTMIIAAVIQASAPSLPVFVVGRGIGGLASGTAATLYNSYINEVSPPHLRGMFGSGYAFAGSTGTFLVYISFFFADTSSGWRYIAGFPIIIASVVLFFGQKHMVESPSWLLLNGQQEEAKRVLASLYGEENVHVALKWIVAKRTGFSQRSRSVNVSAYDPESQLNLPVKQEESVSSPWKALFSKRYRRQTILAVHLALTAQFTGINAVFFYSSIIFKTAGVADGRIGNLVVGIVFLLPTFFMTVVIPRFGNRNMFLTGHVLILIASIGLVLSLSFGVSTLSIVFVGLHVFGFSFGFNCVAFPTGASLFPDAIRGVGTSLMMLVNWIGILIIGICFPYISSALGELSFVPFAAFTVYVLIFMYKFLPHTTGKTNDEIQKLFA